LMIILQRCLVGARLTGIIPRPGVPGTRHHRLIVGYMRCRNWSPNGVADFMISVGSCVASTNRLRARPIKKTVVLGAR
jgi:hypothetical protein